MKREKEKNKAKKKEIRESSQNLKKKLIIKELLNKVRISILLSVYALASQTKYNKFAYTDVNYCFTLLSQKFHINAS